MTDRALTAKEARERTTFSLYHKIARTLISDRTFPPGTVYQTPEGLRAEDEETRAAFDVQGGIYPIRESVFRATYTLDAARPTLDVEVLARAEHRVAAATYRAPALQRKALADKDALDSWRRHSVRLAAEYDRILREREAER